MNITKKILIISYDGGTVNHVIDWLISKDFDVHRINPYVEKIVVKKIEITKQGVDFHMESNGLTIKLSEYSSVWIWHSNLWFDNCVPQVKNEESSDVINMIKRSLDQHHNVLIDYFGEILQNLNLRLVGNYKYQDLNKLEVLLKAREVGIEIPDSYIISQKKDFLDIMGSENFITKPYHEVSYPTHNGITYQNYTSTLDKSDFVEIENEVYPTLIQNKIEKLFEIRTFFLIDKFYSMAIFSQESIKTEIDFRNYNYEKPNRNVAFELPSDLEKKLSILLKRLNLNCGSVDLIYTNDDKFIFLEINPIGQFGMVSYPCNYYLEKKMMEVLTT